MAKYDGCTAKQVEALIPLVAEANDIKRRMWIAEKKLAFKMDLGWGEPQMLREEIDELQNEYEKVAKQITKIYGAKHTMEMCIQKAKKYTAMAETIRRHWEIP